MGKEKIVFEEMPQISDGKRGGLEQFNSPLNVSLPCEISSLNSSERTESNRNVEEKIDFDSEQEKVAQISDGNREFMQSHSAQNSSFNPSGSRYIYDKEDKMLQHCGILRH